METWDEVRTAYYVVREGTVSGAADALGVHHATVIRHIDTLEGRLGVKLFQRHARGYTATEAGEDLARVARATDEQMAQLQGRLKGRGSEVSGELVVTSVPSMTDVLMPIMARFQAEHPEVRLRYHSGNRLFRLEYGEAHVAVRAGPEPLDQPDNVVQKFADVTVGLFASDAYVETYGEVADVTAHRFVGPDDTGTAAPFYRWMAENVPEESVAFRSDDVRAIEAAVRDGIGIGFLPRERALADGYSEVMPPDEDWPAPLWLVTHVDLHRTAKVQAFLAHLKKHADDVSV